MYSVHPTVHCTLYKPVTFFSVSSKLLDVSRWPNIIVGTIIFCSLCITTGTPFPLFHTLIWFFSLNVVYRCNFSWVGELDTLLYYCLWDDTLRYCCWYRYISMNLANIWPMNTRVYQYIAKYKRINCNLDAVHTPISLFIISRIYCEYHTQLQIRIYQQLVSYNKKLKIKNKMKKKY